MRGEDLEPGSSCRDEHDEHLRARRRALLLVEGDRGLVAVVAVRDQELLVVEGADDRRVVDPPELRALDLQVRRAVRAARPGAARRRAGRSARAGRASRAAGAGGPSFGPRVRALVRQHGAGRVRLDLERRDEPVARARDPVGADVLLRERPDGRRLLDEHALRAPLAQLPCRLVLGVGQRQRGRRCAGCGREAPRAARARSRRTAARRASRAAPPPPRRSGGRGRA